MPIVEWREPILRVDDALALVTACIEQNASGVLLDASVLPPAFFDLRTRFAGEFLQKLDNYRVRVAAVLPVEREQSERFREFLAEAKSGQRFRAFAERAAAEAWLSASAPGGAS